MWILMELRRTGESIKLLRSLNNSIIGVREASRFLRFREAKRIFASLRKILRDGRKREAKLSPFCGHAKTKIYAILRSAPMSTRPFTDFSSSRKRILCFPPTLPYFCDLTSILTYENVLMNYYDNVSFMLKTY